VQALHPVLLCGRFDEGEHTRWLTALQAALPEVQWLDLPQAQAAALQQAAAITVAVVANPTPGSLQGLPALRLVQSLWAGVDRLLADHTLPADVALARMVDPLMTAAMVQTALWAVLALHRGTFDYAAHQRASRWQPHAQRRAEDTPVLVLGQGEMGRAVAAALAGQGYPVTGWRRDTTPLAALLPQAQIVVNLLPLTDATRGLLNACFFSALPASASVVNLARGAHVVDEDLLQALDSGHLQRAVLDVFNTEPLPRPHPYWQHPQVTVLPHAAAMTDERSAAQVVAANVRALWAGQPLQHLVDRARGY
jgi:glyoxylate/hydroxypyruvate reductase